MDLYGTLWNNVDSNRVCSTVIVAVLSDHCWVLCTLAWGGLCLDLGFSPLITVIELAGWIWIIPTLLFHLLFMTMKEVWKSFNLTLISVSVSVGSWPLGIRYLSQQTRTIRRACLSAKWSLRSQSHSLFPFQWGFSTSRPTMKSWTSLFASVFVFNRRA